MGFIHPYFLLGLAALVPSSRGSEFEFGNETLNAVDVKGVLGPEDDLLKLLRRQAPPSTWQAVGSGTGCPTYDGQQVLSSGGYAYTLACGADNNAPGASLPAPSLDTCMNYCSDGTWPQCQGVVYASGFQYCYEKQLSSDYVNNANSGTVLAVKNGPAPPAVATTTITTVRSITSTLISTFPVTFTSITTRVVTTTTSLSTALTLTSTLPATTQVATSVQVVPTTIVTVQTLTITTSTISTQFLATIVPTTVVTTIFGTTTVQSTQRVTTSTTSNPIRTATPTITYRVTSTVYA